MKKHRWMLRSDLPVLLIKNEDDDFYFHIYYDIHEMLENPLPKIVFCYDCQRMMSEAFAEPCLAEYDLSIPKELWP